LSCYCCQRIRLLEEKIASATEELNALQLKLDDNPDALKQLERRLRHAENELAAVEVLRDNLHADREKVYLLS